MLSKKKPDIKGHIVYDSIYMKCPEQANPETESRLVVAWEEIGRGENRKLGNDS